MYGSAYWQQVLALISSIAWVSQTLVQVHRNYTIKTMEGMSINFYFLALNATIFYSFYCISGFFAPSPETGTVQLGDLLFALGTLALSSIEGFQFWYYPTGKNKLSAITVFFLIACWLFIISNIFLIEIFGIITKNQYWNVLSLMGYCKLLISFIKYAPAIYWNYAMKTTKGWPLTKVILDIIGGTFSLISGSVSTQDGLNITKLCLAILTLLYDFIFLFQRYLYRNNKGKLSSGIFQQKDKQQSLLASQSHN